MLVLNLKIYRIAMLLTPKAKSYGLEDKPLQAVQHLHSNLARYMECMERGQQAVGIFIHSELKQLQIPLTFTHSLSLSVFLAVSKPSTRSQKVAPPSLYTPLRSCAMCDPHKLHIKCKPMRNSKVSQDRMWI